MSKLLNSKSTRLPRGERSTPARGGPAPVAATPSAARPCATCGEPVRGTPACLFPHEAACPVAVDPPANAGPVALDETLAYRPAASEPLSPPASDNLVHETLAQYRIVEKIGQGSMARVYKAFHMGLGRISAIKVLHPELVARQPRVVTWFEGEARAVAGLIHPHIVTIHNLGHDRGYHYVEMEYVRGGQSLQGKVGRDGPLDPLEAALVVRQLGSALAAAHASGLVHRDVKPANVLLTPDGRAKLADFGLVRRVDDPDAVGGSIAGTPTFMAPELFQNVAPSPRSDLYALGVTLFYLLTARLPFNAEKLAALIRLHRSAPVPDPRLYRDAISDELAALVLRLLAKDPVLRPASADDFLDELDVVVGHLRDTEGLVREGLAGLDCLIQQGGRDQFRIIVPVPGDRVHEVYIEVVEGRKGERLLSVYSVCAPADPRHFEFALRLNAELTYGSLSIRRVSDVPMFVMTRAYPRGQVAPSDIRAAVVEIARRGDWVERQLTSTDLY